MQTFVAGIVAFLSMYQVSANIQHELYSIHHGYEVTSVYQELIVSSISRCAMSCNVSMGCITATFDSQTRRCKLSDLDLGVASNTGTSFMKTVCPARVQNIALKKPAFMSTVSRPPSRGVDGNTNQDFFAGQSCFHTMGETNPWWRVELGNEYYLSYAVLYNRMDHNNDVRAHDINVKVGTDLISMTTIEYIPGVLPAIYEVQMPYMQVAMILEISIQSLTDPATDILHLCEIEVFGYPVLNVALRKGTSMSSLSTDRIASRGVDGDTNQDFYGQSCFHTLTETNPWWRVDLGISYYLDYAVLYNRMDNGRDARAHDILTKVGLALSSMFIIEQLPGTLPSVHVVQMPDWTNARFVEVSIQSLSNPASDTLHLCEIEVYGYPGSSKYLHSYTVRS